MHIRTYRRIIKMRTFAVIVFFLKGISLAFGSCSTIPHIDHTTNNGSTSTSFPEGSVIRYYCDIGYYLSSESNIYTCIKSAWFGQVECKIIKCSYVATPPNGYISNEPDYTAGSRVNYACNDGYELKGPNSLLCRIDGEWDPNTPGICNAKICPEFSSVANGNIHQNTANNIRNSYQSSLELTCHVGYIKKGNDRVECGADGQWTGTFSCEKSTCPKYPTNSSCIDTIEIASSLFILTCKSGRNISVTAVGDGITDCINGEWENTELACYCDCYVNKPILFAVSLNEKGFLKHDEALDWKCPAGHRKTIPDPITCFDGKMTAQPSCVELEKCPEFPAVANGNIHQNASNNIKNSQQSTLTLTCNSGYVKKGNPLVTCGVNGQWSGTFRCVQSRCSEYPTNSSCIDEIETLADLNVLTYVMTCKSGSDVSVTKIGEDGITDCVDGKWEYTEMACYCDCKVNIDHLSSGNLNDKGFLKHGGNLTWECEDFYRKNNLDAISCYDGRLSAHPSCEIKQELIIVVGIGVILLIVVFIVALIILVKRKDRPIDVRKFDENVPLK